MRRESATATTTREMAGGLTSTARQLTTQSNKASVHRVFPCQYYDMTYANIIKAAHNGDKAAKTAVKLLRDLRFTK